MFFRISFFSLIAILCLSCTTASNEPVLRVGANVWLGYGPWYIAKQNKYWNSDEIRIVEYPSASEVLRAFRNNALDAASLTLDEVLHLRELNIPVSVVLVHDVSAGGDVIIAKQGIEQISDLENKVIGVESGALGAYIISRALELTGMSESQFVIKNIEVDMHRQAFQSKEVDAVVTFEPVRTWLLSNGGHEIFSSKQIPEEIVDVFAVRQEFLEKHPDLVKKLINSWFKAVELLESNPRESTEIIAQNFKLSAAEVQQGIAGLNLPDRSQNKKMLGGESPILEDTLQKVKKLMIGKELLKGEIDTSNLYTDKYL